MMCNAKSYTFWSFLKSNQVFKDHFDLDFWGIKKRKVVFCSKKTYKKTCEKNRFDFLKKMAQATLTYVCQLNCSRLLIWEDLQIWIENSVSGARYCAPWLTDTISRVNAKLGSWLRNILKYPKIFIGRKKWHQNHVEMMQVCKIAAGYSWSSIKLEN